MATPRKRKQLTIDQKCEIIQAVEKKTKSKTEIAKNYGINPSTLTEILKRKDSIITASQSGDFSPKRKRIRLGVHEDVENALYKWFISARDKNVPISGDILMKKADFFAKELGISDFKASSGFIDRFKTRRGIVCKVVCGESAGVSQPTVIDWKNKLPDLISEYEPHNIFNADETGLFFKCEPNKSLHLRGEECHGGKRSKERVSLLLGSNMDGSEKLKPLLIGKFKNPRCFKGIKSFPVTYKFNKRAWMTGEIFIDWLNDLDKKNHQRKA
jgi:hypothetical protein